MQIAGLFLRNKVLGAVEEGLLHEHIDHMQRDGRMFSL